MFVHYTNDHLAYVWESLCNIFLEVLLTLHFSLVCVCARVRIWTKFGESPKFPIAELFILLPFFFFWIQDRNSILA